jgi:hypothetical protein
MKSRLSSTERFLSELAEEYLHGDAPDPRISRRELLRSGAGTAVVTAIGIGGLLELLANREAVAAGLVIGIVGVTRERMPLDETPHRHTFVARFQVNHVSPSSIFGTVVGRTDSTISTSSVEEERHFHNIPMTNTSLEQLVVSGPENNEPGEHVHQLSIE